MSNIIKLKIPKASSPDGPSRPPLSATPSSSGIKLKLVNSQPSTPLEGPKITIPASTEKKAKRPYVRKTDANAKKRAADDDISTPAKRISNGAGPSRKLSIKLSSQQRETPGSSGKIALGKKKAAVPKIIDIRARQRAPPRAKGIGYDSEDSDVEKDPAIQQALVLRMQPGEDAEYLRQAIADGRIGPHPSSGDADVSLKFVEKTYRRAVVKVRGNSYAAVLVDLPCIVETMKSFDKKNWYKVADCCQMLLVLGRCQNDEEARNYRLPSDVNKENFQFAHGLTPPLRRVRERRWRNRPNYNHAVAAEEQAQRLLDMDKLVEESGGTTSYTMKKSTEVDYYGNESQFDEDEMRDGDADADGEEDDGEGDAMETIEGGDGQRYTFGDEEEEVDDEEDAADLEAQLAAQMAFDDDEAAAAAAAELSSSQRPSVSVPPETVEATPIGTPGAGIDGDGDEGDDGEEQEAEESSSDDDDDEDSDGMDVFDEDAAAKTAERNQQMEEVADLEQEIARTRQKAQAMTNMLLKQREMRKLEGLEEDLKAKKAILGLEEE